MGSLKLYYLTVAYIFDLIPFYFLSYLTQALLVCFNIQISQVFPFSALCPLLFCVGYFAFISSSFNTQFRKHVFEEVSLTTLARESIIFSFVYLIVIKIVLFFYKHVTSTRPIKMQSPWE